MFVMKVDKNIATIIDMEPMTSGSSKVYLVKFLFSPEWDDLSRVAVFRTDETVIDVLLDDSNVCFMPGEVMTEHGNTVQFGVYGTKDGDVVLPTIWAETEVVLEGVTTGLEAQPPSPSLMDQVLDHLAKVEKKCDDLTSSGVISFNGRLGEVVPEEGDYDIEKIEGLKDSLGEKIGRSDKAEKSDIDSLSDSKWISPLGAAEMIGQAISSLPEPEDPVTYEFGHGLKEDGNTISLNMWSEDNPDKTLPISVELVEAMLGDVEELLRSI